MRQRGENRLAESVDSAESPGFAIGDLDHGDFELGQFEHGESELGEFEQEDEFYGSQGAGLFDSARLPGGSVYKFGLAFFAGVGIWLVVSMLSPATLVDTSTLVDSRDLTDESATAAALVDATIDVGSQESPTALNVAGTIVAGVDGQLDQVGTEAPAESATTETAATETSSDETAATETTGAAAESISTETSSSAATATNPQPAAAADTTAGTPTSKAPAATTGTPSSAAPTTTATTAAPTTTAAPATQAPTTAAITGSLDYRSNLEMIRSVSVRNKNHDNSPYRNTASASLNLQALYGPRNEYLGNPGGNPEQAFPVANGGQFRTGCEFSHFAYDDPLIYPGKPGASHLHMYFGNTDVNAFSTYDSLLNSGSSTCNGQELNRTGYWVPAVFDGNGNVRIPERVVVYYKGEGLARGNSEVYPAGAALIATKNLNTLPESQGGVPGKYTYVCSDKYSSNGGASSQTMPNCSGSNVAVLEMNVKFPQCWNGKDPANWENYRSPTIGWYSSLCNGEFSHTLPNMEYFVNYRVEAGENTSNWFLSSDVDPTSFGASKATPGSTSHGDWWGAWNKEINQMWIDNCVNYKSGTASGCGFGYLSDGGPNGSSPAGGPALKLRPQYNGPSKVSAAELMSQLCPNPKRSYSKPEDAAYCAPGTGL